MRIKITIIAIMLVTIGLVFLSGCYKVTTLTLNNEQEITTAVNFSTDVIPLFSKNCALSGCHNTGGHIPDLSSDKAYNSLINGNYVDLGTPENSSIYLWLTGKKSSIMPVGAANNPSNINQYVLAWIKQGAKNN